MTKKLLYILIAMTMLVGCNKKVKGGDDPVVDTELTTFKSKLSCGLYVKGNDTFVADDYLHQIAVNKTKNTYRIQTDIQDTYIHIELASKPTSVGDETSATITTKGISSLTSGTRTVSLQKIVSNKLWLWDKEAKIGFLIEL